MRAFIVVSCLTLMLTFSAPDANAEILQRSDASQAWGSSLVVMVNETWSDDLAQDVMFVYGIGAQNASTTTPFTVLGPSGWFDIPLTASYLVRWVVQASPVYGVYLTFGDHRMILNDLSIVNLTPPQTVDAYFYSGYPL